MHTLSIVVPCYNEEESLPIFMAEVHRVAQSMRERGVSFEMVLIDDGSRDGTLAQFRAAERYESDWFHVRWYSFSRNFGKEAGILAGLEHATGDYVAYRTKKCVRTCIISAGSVPVLGLSSCVVPTSHLDKMCVRVQGFLQAEACCF